MHPTINFSSTFFVMYHEVWNICSKRKKNHLTSNDKALHYFYFIFWEGLNQYGSTSRPTPQCAEGMETDTGTVKVMVKVTMLSHRPCLPVTKVYMNTHRLIFIYEGTQSICILNFHSIIKQGCNTYPSPQSNALVLWCRFISCLLLGGSGAGRRGIFISVKG